MKGFLSFMIIIVGHPAAGMCPPLVAPKGTLLTCEDPVYSQRLDCSASWLQQGTIARFRCVNDQSKRVKGRILCFDGGIYKVHNRFINTTRESQDLPCKIRQNVNKEEMHLYGYEQPASFPLTKNINDFHLLALVIHNQFRDAHGSPPLQLRGNLSSLAQAWADKTARTGTLDMATESRFGQNVFLATSDNLLAAVNDAIQNWYYAGLREYRWDDVAENWDSPTALQFSQMIWMSSKALGVGAAPVGNRTVVVAFYDPPGNLLYEGDEIKSERSFIENVLRRRES